MERMMGIEPTRPAWKAGVLPVSYTHLDNQIVATVVEEDVAFALENLGVPPAEIRTRIDEAMKMAGIYKHREKAPHKLSGGQKQRVAIAGVIAMRPDCLILDEATAMLDPIGREKVKMCIRDRFRAKGPAVRLFRSQTPVHRAVAPHGTSPPVAVTGRPISSHDVEPPKRDAMRMRSMYSITLGERPVV